MYIQGFPADVMHDCLESIMPVITYTIVKRMVAQKLVTVAQFNAKLASFQFRGSDRVNKPELLKSDCYWLSITQNVLILAPSFPCQPGRVSPCSGIVCSDTRSHVVCALSLHMFDGPGLF